ncbi:MAG TPA: hypothetical protein VE978_07055, partial [Chitinophagales bacterium]|nr:hypothetical protein [Chitinophagales bacterium]
MKTSSLILSLFFVSITNAQTTFQKSFNLFSYDNGTSIEQTSDGGFIIGGYAGDTPYDIKACLIKTNAAGDINWIRYFGGSNLYYGWSARETSDGGFILSGWIDSLGSSNSNVYVVKTNVNGVLEWSKTYDIANNDRGICIRETSDAGFIICGVNWPVGFSLTILDLIKIDSTGDVEWMKNYYQTADIGFGQALYVIQTTDGGFMVTGFMNNGAGLLKTDSVGNVEWMKTYGDADWSTVAREVCQTSDGGYVAAGYTFVNFGDQDLFLFRTNASGDTLWTKTFNHGIVEEIHSLKVT